MIKDAKKLTVMLLILVFTAAISAAGCTGTQNEGTITPTEIPTIEQTTEMTTAPVETPAASSEAGQATNSGKGSKNIKMSLDDGITLLTFEQNTPEVSDIAVDAGSSHFSIQNTFPADKSIYMNEDGKYVSSQAFILIGGENTEISVETDSEWMFSFSFPQMINGIPPQTFEGAGNQATPFFQINKGKYKFSIKTEDNSFICVQLMDYDGNELTEGVEASPLPYQKGEYDGVVTVDVENSNNYLLNINCDGKWTVSVEKA